MARRLRWSLPLAFALAACQAPAHSPAAAPAVPAPAAAPQPDPVFEVPAEPFAVAWRPGSNPLTELDASPFETPQASEPAPVSLPPYNGDVTKFYPDLTGIAPSSFYIDGRDGRYLLRFPTAIGNSGPGLLRIRGRVMGNITQGTQEIVDGNGRVIATKDVGTFEYHPTHGHFHVSYVARYELKRGSDTGEKVQDGLKISFCMEDSIRFGSNNQWDSQLPNCSETLQGITPGFADVYSAALPEQVFDMTELGSGDYTLTIQLDPTKKFLETNRNNNYAWVKFHYDAEAKKAYRLADYP
jgi:hypothetical protein